MLFRDVIAVCGRIAPFDLDSFRVNQAVDLECFRALPTCIWNSDTSRLWISNKKAEFGSFFKKPPRCIVEESSLILIDVYQLPFLVRYPQYPIYEKVRRIILLHFDNAVIYFLFQIRCVFSSQFSNLLFST